MDRDLEHRVAAWQQAESAADDDAADRAFAAVASGWPRAAVPRRVVDGALARLGIPGPVRASAWRSWWVRSAVAIPVLLAGVALSWHSAASLGSAAVWTFQAVASGVDTVLWAAGAWTETVITVGRSLARAGLAVGLTLAEPVPAVVCVLNVVLSAAALGVLRRVLAVREV